MAAPEQINQAAALRAIRNAGHFTPGAEVHPRVVMVPPRDRPLAGLRPESRNSGTFIPGRPETRVAPQDAVHVPTDKLVAAIQRDRVIKSELADREQARQRDHAPVEVNGVSFRNPELGKVVAASRTPGKGLAEGYAEVTDHVRKKGTLKLSRRNGHKVVVSGEEVGVVTIGATETKVNGDMDQKYWIRDQALIGKSYFELWRQNREQYRAEGDIAREVLLSTMHLMSTDAQLEKFQNIINSDDPAFKADMRNWPQIAIEGDKLDSKEPTKWRHKQEAWQMLGITVLDALDAGLISPTDLKEGNKTFLRSMAPFLESVDFTHVENMGSWEEGSSMRTSVVAVETALLHRVSQVSGDPRFDFLRGGQEPAAFKRKIDGMVQTGLEALGQRLPDESPNYDPADPRYRTADAALFYLLDYGLPQLLADKGIKIKKNNNQPMDARSIEIMVLEQLAKLDDPETHGLRRYGLPGDPIEDTYLGMNFTTDKAQLYVNGVKAKVEAEANGGSIDTNRKSKLRQMHTETGSPAAWVHPRFQLAAYGAGMYLETGDEFYLDIAMSNLDYGLANITGSGDYHAIWNGETHDVIQAAPYQVPEATMTIEHDGIQFKVPSPHVPLNWGVGEANRALGLTTAAARKYEMAVATAPGEHELFQGSV